MNFFLEIRYLIGRYAELNHLLVGSSLIPLNIELQQDARTVCCGHTDVHTVLRGHVSLSRLPTYPGTVQGLASFGSQPYDFSSLSNCGKSLGQSGMPVP